MGRVTIFEVPGRSMESTIARKSDSSEVMIVAQGMRLNGDIGCDNKIGNTAAMEPRRMGSFALRSQSVRNAEVTEKALEGRYVE